MDAIFTGILWLAGLILMLRRDHWWKLLSCLLFTFPPAFGEISINPLPKPENPVNWDDFEKHIYTETGSGLYIRIYEIDKLFSLWIGGTSLDEQPMYIYLKTNDRTDDQIDICTEPVEEFINEIPRVH